MCGRYGLIASPQDLAQRYARPVSGPYQASADVRPTEIQPILAQDDPSALHPLPWGIYTPIQGKTAFLINARVDKLRSFIVYRTALAQHRCLIPAQVFYEWQTLALKQKQQMQFAVPGQPIFSFAGLTWTFDHPKTGQRTTGYVILTTEANETVTPVHDRMPVILPREVEDLWLHPDTPQPVLLDLLRAYPADEMICGPFRSEDTPPPPGSLFAS